MSDTPAKPVWGVYGGSTRGSAHLRSGLPNQDSLGKWAGPGGVLAILAVSDGHGSASHFRSEIGSRMGVETAVQALRQTPVPVPEGHAQVLARAIVQSWREAVMAHLAAHPFTDQEWAKLPPKEAAQSKAVILANPPVAYGATLLAVLAAQDEILYLQLGDGDILCVDRNGGTTRPVPPDARLIANQTTSLCQNGAVEDFRAAHFRSSQGAPPALILVSSDGYANSFLSDEDFLRLGPDYLELLRQYGAEKVQAQLEKILPEASRKGSGDDITLGFIQRMDTGFLPDRLPETSASVAASPPGAPPPSPPPVVKGEARPAATVAAPGPTPTATEKSVPLPAPAAAEAAAPIQPAAVIRATEPRSESAATVVTRGRLGPTRPVAGAAAPKAAPQPGPRPGAAAAKPEPRAVMAASPVVSGSSEETARLRRKVFWLKVALAGVFTIALAGAGLAYWRPMWVSHVWHRVRPGHESPDSPNSPRGPRSHPGERRPPEDPPRTRDRSNLGFRLQNCSLDSPGELDPVARPPALSSGSGQSGPPAYV